MFVARGDSTIGEGRLRWACVFARKVWALVVERHGLTLDTTFVPAAQGPPKDAVCIYLLMRGSWTITSDRTTFAGPCGFVLTQDALEGAEGVRRFGFRAEGDPFLVLQVYAKPEDVRIAVSDRPTSFPLDASLIASATRAAELARASDADLVEGMSDVLRGLARLGVVDRKIAETALEPVAIFERLWEAIRPTAERLLLSPTLDELSTASGMSSRQMERTIERFLETFAFVGTGWRSASRHLRIKLAVLFLSAEGTTIADVAIAAGYGSTEAMARAFRDASIPPPSVVRAAIQRVRTTR